MAAARAGAAEPGPGFSGHVPARVAHDAFHSARGVGCDAQLSAPAGLAGEPPAVWHHVAQLASRRRGQPQGQMGGNLDDVCQCSGPAAHRGQAVGCGGSDCLHGNGAGLVVATA